MAAIRDRRVPRTYGVEPELRRKRLLAARKFAAGSVPRIAILLGHWDAGEAVASAGASLKEQRNARRPRAPKKRKKPPQGRED